MFLYIASFLMTEFPFNFNEYIYCIIAMPPVCYWILIFFLFERTSVF